jgi:hypothetical protein
MKACSSLGGGLFCMGMGMPVKKKATDIIGRVYKMSNERSLINPR